MLPKCNTASNTRIQTAQRAVKLRGNLRLRQTDFPLSGAIASATVFAKSRACRKPDTTERQTGLCDQLKGEPQNGKRSDRLLAMANFRSHASFLTANFSTPFSGSFRTHFVVFSKRDVNAANSSFRSDYVLAFLSRRSIEREEAGRFGGLLNRRTSEDTSEGIIRQTRFATARETIEDFGIRRHQPPLRLCPNPGKVRLQ